MSEMQYDPSKPADDHLDRLMVEAFSDETFCRVDETGTIRSWNAGGIRLFGYRASEIVGMPVSCLLAEGGLGLGQGLDQVRQQGHWESQGWLVQQDGSRFWGSITCKALREDDDQTLGYVVRFLDLTAQRQESDLMRISEQRFRTLFEQSPISIQIFRPDGLAVTANQAWERMWASTVEIMQGYNILRDPQVDAIGLRPYIELAFAGEVVRTPILPYDPRHIGREGRPRWFEGLAYPVNDDQGELQEVVLLHVDITDQKDAEEAIRSQQQWLEAVLDQMPDPLLLLEPKTGKIIFANRAMQRVSEFPLEKGAEADFCPPGYTISDPDGRPLPRAAFPVNRAAQGEELDGLAMNWNTPHGTMSLLVFSQTLQARFGHPPTIIITFLDVTALQNASKELKQALNARNEFLSIASHELRTPLTSLQLAVQHALSQQARDMLSGETLIRALEMILRQTKRLARLISSLLDVSHLNAGQMSLKWESVDMTDVATEVITRHEAEAERAHCPVTLETTGAVVGRWDRLRLDQVITNLLTNALKFGSGTPISLRVTLDGQFACLDVQDQGIGIDPASRERLFQQFERLVSSRNYGGLGLGLWISRQNVVAMGGTITVTSHPGEGACFTVRLPLSGPPTA